MISEALAILPSLQLNALAAEDAFRWPGNRNFRENNDSYQAFRDRLALKGKADTVRRLLRTDGWKEMRFLSPTTEFLTTETLQEFCHSQGPGPTSKLSGE